MLYEDMKNISKIVETSSYNEVNEFLNEGWKLIDTYTTTVSAENNDQVVMYVLGKSRD